MRLLFYFLLFSVLIYACKGNKQKGRITIAEYTFNFPNDFELVEERGIDSYVGKIKNRSLWLGFDYGYYSNPLIETPQEYLDKGFWKMDAYSRFVKPQGSYTPEMVREIQLLGTKPIQTKADSSRFKGADLIAKCRLDTSTFDYGITFPDKIKTHNFLVDTIKGHYRKIVVAKDPGNGITGIFIKDLNGFNQSINAFSALSMATNGLTKQMQDSIINVFRNVVVTQVK
jgi:hypothetical protein